MITFENGIDARCMEPKAPEVAKFHIAHGKYAYCIIGTDYGYLHTVGGAVRIWETYSGASKAKEAYILANK